MGDVVSIEDFRPHCSGEAVCSQCKHEWVAVAPLRTTELQCPSCSTYKGLFKYPFRPQAGQWQWVCNCGGEVFFIVDGETRCWICGDTSMGWINGN